MNTESNDTPFFHWLISPHPSVKDDGERDRIRAFLRINLLFIAFTIIISAANIFTGQTFAENALGTVSALVLIVGTYAIGRTQRYQLGMWVFLVGINTVIALSLTQIIQPFNLGFFLVPIFMAAVFLSPRDSIIIAVFAFIATVAVTLSMDAYRSPEIIIPSYSVIAAGAVLAINLAFLRQRDVNKLEARTLTVQELNRDLETRVDQRTRELETAVEVSQQVSTSLEVEDLLPQLVELTKERFDLYHAHVYLLNDEGDRLELIAGSGEAGDMMVAAKHAIAADAERSIVAQTARTGITSLIKDTRNEPNFLPNPLLPATRAELALPLKVGDQVLGVLDVQDDETDAFSPDNIRVLDTLARQVAVAVQNARSYGQVQAAQAETAQALQRLAEQNRISSGVAEFATDLLGTGLDGLDDSLGDLGVGAYVERVFVMRLVGDGQMDVFHEWEDENVKTLGIARQDWQAAAPDWLETLRSREIVMAEGEHPLIEDAAKRLMLPIHVGDELYGALMLDSQDPEREWTDEQVDLLGAAAVSIAYAVRSNNLLAQTESALNRVQNLYDLSRRLTNTQTLEEMLNTISQPADMGKGIFSALVLNHSESEEIEIAASHTSLMNGRIIPEETIYPRETFPDITNNANRLHHLHDLSTMGTDNALRAELEAIGLESLTIIPLTPSGGGEWLGAVVFGWAEPDLSLDEAMVELYTLLAPQVATTVENRLLLEQTQETLSELDRIYSLPTELMGSASIDGHYQSLNPAWETNLGYTRAEHLHRRIDEFVHPDDKNKTLNALRRLASGRRDAVQFDNRYEDADGNYRWLRWNTTLDPERRLIYFSARDITDERRNQERQELAYSLGEQISTVLDPETLLQNSVDMIAETFDYYHVHIYAYDEEKRLMRVAAGLGEAGEQLRQRGHTIPVDSKRSLVAQAARTLEPVVVNDVTADPAHLPNPLIPKTKSEVTVPIASGSRLLGVLDVQEDTVNAFSDDDVQTLKIVTNQLAIALSNATLFEQTESALAQTEMLYAASEQIVRADDPSQIFGGVTFSTFLGQYMSQVMMVSFPTPWNSTEESGRIPIGEVQGVWEVDEYEVGETINLTQKPYAPLVNQHEEVIITDVALDETLDEEMREALQAANIGSFVSTPVVSPGGTIALVLATAEEPIDIDDDQKRQLLTLTDQAATVLQNIRLLERTQATLNELATNQEQLQLFVENTPAAVAMFNTDMEYLVVSRRWYEDFRLDPNNPLVGKSHYTVFDHQDEKWQDIHQDALDGIAQSSPSDEYTHPDGDRDFLRWQIYPWYDASDNIGGIVWFTEIITDEVRTRRRQQTAYELARQLTTSLDIDTLLTETVNRLAESFNYYYAQVYFMERDADIDPDEYGPQIESEVADILVVREGLGEAGAHLKLLEHSLPVQAGRSLVARAARTGEPVVVNNTRDDPNHLPNPLLPDTASEVAIPLISGDRTIGVLDIQQDSAYYFDEEEIQTLQIVANQLAVAIANAEFFNAVEQARSNYALLAENATDVISRHSLDGTFTYVSPAAEQLLEYTTGELVGMSIFQMMHPEDVKGYGFGKRSLFDQADVVTIEYRIQRKDETYIWFETTARAIFDPSGDIAEMVAVSREITDRVVARERQQTAYDLAQELSTSLDQEVLLQRTVNRLAEAFGLYHAHIYLLDEDEEALVVKEGLGAAGQQLKELSHSIPMSAARSVVARSARGREPVIVDDVMDDVGHLPNPLLPRTRSELALPLNIGDSLLGVLDVQHDVPNYFTQDVVQTLAIVSNQLSVAISNAKLYESQIETAERLREVDQLKSEFLATMSHELRTPLNSIIGYSELLIDELQQDIDSMSMEDLNAIHSSGHHLLAIINDILDIAKIESGRMEINRTQVNVADFVQQVSDMTRVQLRDKDAVEMRTEIPDDVPTIFADSVRLRQMMLNLTGNAVKFTEEGSITLQVTMDKTWMYLKVIDTGAGIPEDAQDKVFDRFSQADSSATRKAGGTGLGLTVSRQLAELHGGDLYLEESTPGVGSTFTLKLPLEAPNKPQRATSIELGNRE